MPVKIIKIIFLFLVLSGLLIFQINRSAAPHQLEVYFLAVGQGDALLIRTPQNQDILIDGGPDNSALEQISQILPFWDRQLELVILTHPHDDHLLGLLPILEKYQVSRIISAPVNYDNINYANFQQLVMAKNIPQQPLYYSQQLFLEDDIYLQFLYPFNNLDLNQIANLNNISSVFKLVKDDQAILFTGDAEAEVEQALLANNIDLTAAVLKVGHHGSKTASTEQFLQAVQPHTAIISSGAGNKFKHPHFQTLFNLQKLGITILRTDAGQNVKCQYDDLTINCYNYNN